ncbi:DUF6455 family protein [Roseovarius sp. TE539]|uniref:DUF6455 family protein n=1 Tax=Roseovarius sp. TE539 TaxID=2249812 RepID=UPI0028527613|nr:DUF6455 family protein [Roseovarius sp. TE539]
MRELAEQTGRFVARGRTAREVPKRRSLRTAHAWRTCLSTVGGGRVMKPLGNERRHYWLLKRMAQTTGADPVAARANGYLDCADWSRMVQRCRGCAWRDACDRWLAETTAAPAAPKPCRNRAALALMKLDAQLSAAPVS